MGTYGSATVAFRGNSARQDCSVGYWSDHDAEAEAFRRKQREAKKALAALEPIFQKIVDRFADGAHPWRRHLVHLDRDRARERQDDYRIRFDLPALQDRAALGRIRSPVPEGGWGWTESCLAFPRALQKALADEDALRRSAIDGTPIPDEVVATADIGLLVRLASGGQWPQFQARARRSDGRSSSPRFGRARLVVADPRVIPRAFTALQDMGGADPAPRPGIFMFREFFRDRRIASVKSTSMYLVRRICRRLDLGGPRVVVELGPGLGCFTRTLLRCLSADSTLILIESNSDFARALHRIREPRLQVACTDADDLKDVLRQAGRPQADVVLSGIPFSHFGEARTMKLLEDVRAILAESGVFVAYQSSARLEKYLKRVFPRVRVAREMFHIPPLVVLEARAA